MARFSPLGRFRAAKSGRRESNPAASDYNALEMLVLHLQPAFPAAIERPGRRIASKKAVESASARLMRWKPRLDSEDPLLHEALRRCHKHCSGLSR